MIAKKEGRDAVFAFSNKGVNDSAIVRSDAEDVSQILSDFLIHWS
jgi:hypothetical protein